MPLTELSIKHSKPKETDYKLADEKGMYLFVRTTGGKYFRMDYRYAGKRKTYAIGVYPEVSLKEAREKRDAARKLLADGIDPMENKKAKKIQLIIEATNTFQAVAAEWFDKMKEGWVEAHAQKKWRLLEKNVFPVFGDTPIRNITSRELLTLLEKIQARGVIDVAYRVKSACRQVFMYGIRTGRCERDPSQDIAGALIPSITKHMATLTDPKKVGGLLRVIDAYQGHFVTQCALKLSPYLMLRPIELRHMEWSELDFEKKLLKIPADKMKMRRIHIVPLAEQAITILRHIQKVTGQGKYVFPSPILGPSRPIANNAIIAALSYMGFKGEMTAHGFRGMASTLLYESNKFKSEVIEMQLAHGERNKVKAAYNHAEYLDERRAMLQWFADYLDELRSAKP